MGNTFSQKRGSDALEGVFGDGQETTVCSFAGEPMAELCRKFAISRNAEYKIFG